MARGTHGTGRRLLLGQATQRGGTEAPHPLAPHLRYHTIHIIWRHPQVY